MSLRERLAAPVLWLGRALAGTLSVRVDDSPGWGMLSDRPHERTHAEIQELYEDTIEAWRKNPMAKRAIDITTDYVIGDGISISSSFKPLQRYIEAFWNHRKNEMSNRLEGMCNELTIAGDLFPVLFTNPFDGLSYIRFVTKDRISEIVTARNDWETELSYIEIPRIYEQTGEPLDPIEWVGAENPSASDSPHVMLHYSVNKPIGTLMGEGDLVTMIPWLLRYSRMLEDRVRLHSAVRSFLWFVRVPSHLVESKESEYAVAPEAGSVVVHDDAEEWDVKTPNLQGSDAAHDLESTRRMIYSGSSFPPHWFAEKGSNRAEAVAMQRPAERHLLRRQRYFVYMLQDMLYQGYQRARVVSPRVPSLPSEVYRQLFAPSVPDVSRDDNKELADAAETLMGVWRGLVLEEEPKSRTLTTTLLEQVFKFMGEPQEASKIRKMVDEIFSAVDGNSGEEKSDFSKKSDF
ncbi:MAG: hypothetical protein ACOC9E_05055 [Chloroflexota bacterium]